MMAVVKDRACEGARDGEKYQPVAGREFELEFGKSWIS